MLTAAIASQAAKAAWPIVRALLPPVLLVLALLACIYGAHRWHSAQVEAAAKAATDAAEQACAASAAKAERDARRQLAEAERRAIEDQARASADYEARIDQLLTNYRTLRSRHAQLTRANPPHPDCRVPADRLRLLRDAIRGPAG